METRRNSVKLVTLNLDFDVDSGVAKRRDRSAIASFDGELILLPETEFLFYVVLLDLYLKFDSRLLIKSIHKSWRPVGSDRNLCFGQDLYSFSASVVWL
jgi:hypothetical protein